VIEFAWLVLQAIIRILNVCWLLNRFLGYIFGPSVHVTLAAIAQLAGIAASTYRSTILADPEGSL